MATKVRQWRRADERDVRRAIEAGDPLQRCDCCGGALPPYDVWELLRSTGRGPDCTGSVDSHGNCRAFGEIMP